jgi:site-specific recombinase XerC
VVELAEDWLTAKRALESAAQAEKGHSDRARRADLERWALVLAEVRGRSPTDDSPVLSLLALGDLSEEALTSAMAAAKRRWSDATVARMLSTLRGFTRWLHRRGHLQADPLDGDLFRAPPRPERRPKAPDADDVDRILAAAELEPGARQRMFWPARDAALMVFLATTGARAEETCGVSIAEFGPASGTAHLAGWPLQGRKDPRRTAAPHHRGRCR